MAASGATSTLNRTSSKATTSQTRLPLHESGVNDAILTINFHSFHKSCYNIRSYAWWIRLSVIRPSFLQNLVEEDTPVALEEHNLAWNKFQEDNISMLRQLTPPELERLNVCFILTMANVPWILSVWKHLH